MSVRRTNSSSRSAFDAVRLSSALPATVVIGLLLPLLAAGLVTTVIISDRVDNQVGKCVTVAANQVDVQFVDCGMRHDGVITQVVDRADQCPADSLGAVSRQTSSGLNTDGGKVLCVGPPR
jgi:hypothetical protein